MDSEPSQWFLLKLGEDDFAIQYAGKVAGIFPANLCGTLFTLVVNSTYIRLGDEMVNIVKQFYHEEEVDRKRASPKASTIKISSGEYVKSPGVQVKSLKL